MATNLQYSTSSAMHSTTASPVPYWNLPGRVLLSIMMILIMAVAIFGNALVIIVIARNKGMQTRTNFFLMNLAVADFLCGCIDMPFSLVTVIRGEWIFSNNVCQMNSFATPFFFVASIHTLMYIAIFKFMSIHDPFRFALSRFKICLLIGAAWGWAAIIGTLSVVGLSKAEFEHYTTQCGPNYAHDTNSYVYFAIILITCYVVPLGVIAGCNVGMFYEIRSHSRRLRNTSTVDRDKIYSQQRGIVVTLLVVVIAFVVTWTPWVVYSLYAIFATNDNIAHWVNPITFWFGYANSACNPVIYALRSQTFREGYKQVVAKRSPKADGYIGAAQSSQGSHFWQTNSRIYSSFLRQNSTREKSRFVDMQPIKRRRMSSAGSLPDGFVTGLGHDKELVEYIPLSHLNGNPQPDPLGFGMELDQSTHIKPRSSVRAGHRGSSRAKRHESVEPRHHQPQIVVSDEVENEPVVSIQRSRSSHRARAVQRPVAPKPTFKEVQGLAPDLKKWLISRKLGRLTENPDVIEVFTDIQAITSLYDAHPSSDFKSNLESDFLKEYSQSVCSLCSNPECEIKHEASSHGKHKTHGHAKKSKCKNTGGQYQRNSRHKTEHSKPHMLRFPSIDELDKVQPKRHVAHSASTRHRNPFVLVEKWYHKHKHTLKPEFVREHGEQSQPLNRNSFEYEHIIPGMFRSSSAPCL